MPRLTSMAAKIVSTSLGGEEHGVRLPSYRARVDGDRGIAVGLAIDCKPICSPQERCGDRKLDRAVPDQRRETGWRLECPSELLVDDGCQVGRLLFGFALFDALGDDIQ